MKELKNIRKSNELTNKEKELIKLIDKNQTRLNRWIDFELELRMLKTKDSILSKLKHDIMTLALSEKFGDNNEIFIENTKTSFYEEIDELLEYDEKLYNKLFKIVLFVEDYLM